MSRFTIIIPTRNEAENIETLIQELDSHVSDLDAEFLFVDDSDDGTVAEVSKAAVTTTCPVRLIHRHRPVGQLAGAVVVGLLSCKSPWVIVMDGDLQHPPEDVRRLMTLTDTFAADVILASRYANGGGGVAGLDGKVRWLASRASTFFAKVLFPVRLRHCSDPLSGLFAVRRAAIHPERLAPSGFKILLEILVRHHLETAELPFTLARRADGDSKATLRQGLRLAQQLISLRCNAHPQRLSLRSIRRAHGGAGGAVSATDAVLCSLGTLAVKDLTTAPMSSSPELIGPPSHARRLEQP